MFVTILSAIYFSIAVFIVVRFIKEKTEKFTKGNHKLTFKWQRAFINSRYYKKTRPQEKQMST